ncbi:hypothetical protein SDC9_106238 [bioreactor metagenome]|uniref:Uncharacterized protein n=1 Tax=bioreactor metagenome TaxID=1076179 RepID=A0A645B2U3_9ZZZZ|nr:hypothetical protein [Oscillospiraceae bacterium]
MYLMKFKHALCSFVELILVIIVLLASIVYTDIFGISIRFNAPTVIALLVVGTWFLSLSHNIIFVGIKVIIDLVTKNFVKHELIFEEQFPYKSSFLSEKRKIGKDGEIKQYNILDFKIVARENGVLVILTSEAYFSLERKTKYLFTVGKYSNYVVDIEELNGIAILSTQTAGDGS